MLNTILYRGPDDRGGWQDPERRAALLHCRLAIVDVERGRQPMQSGEGDVTIVFDGEIYGFERHRRRLEAAGFRFRTRSDTEVLLALYLHHGPDFVKDLEGEFAFVIWDTRKRRAVLARDLFGVKPLFFAKRDGLLLFGSEIKAILAHPFAQRAIDPAVLHRRMHGVMLPEETVFRGVEAVAPGTTMIVEASGGITCRRHADLEPEAAGTLSLDWDAAVEAFEESFSAAVRDRLQGDVPVGLYLSGGVDSSTTAEVLREVSNARHTAFTINFDVEGVGEAEDAAATAKRLGYGHVVEPVGADDIEAQFARSIWHSETTVINAHGTAKQCLSARTAQHVKVVLAGEGADEIHGGFAWHRHAALLQSAHSGRSNRAALKAFLADHGALDGVLTRATPRLRRRLSGRDGLGVPYAALRASAIGDLLWGLLDPGFRAAAGADPTRHLLDWLDERSPAARGLDDVTVSRFVSAMTDMSTYNLSYLGDRTEMANGVEGRLPYLDRRVVDLLWRLPAEFHVSATSNKTLIRAALAKRMPDKAERYKRMFLVPGSIGQGLFEGAMARRWLSAEATRSAGFFRPAAVRGVRLAYASLPRTSGFRRVLEGFLITALSAHVLDYLFCKDFSGSLEEYGPAPTRAGEYGRSNSGSSKVFCPI